MEGGRPVLDKIPFAIVGGIDSCGLDGAVGHGSNPVLEEAALSVDLVPC